MKKKLLFFAGCLFITVPSAYSQVGIGTETPDNSSILDVVSTTKGALFPRVTLTATDMDLDGETGQAEGLLIYNLGGVLSEGYYY